MDYLTGILCLCIGQAVAWLIAIYSERGAYLLLWDSLFATTGAFLCALAINWIAPTLGVIGLVTAGPLCALLMVIAGHAIRRAVIAFVE